MKKLEIPCDLLVAFPRTKRPHGGGYRVLVQGSRGHELGSAAAVCAVQTPPFLLSAQALLDNNWPEVQVVETLGTG